MTRMGSKKKPYFRLVVTEGRTALQSSFVENLGTYNPRTKPAKVEINRDRVTYWLKRGAKPSDSVRTLLARHVTRDLSTFAAATVDKSTSAEATAGTPAAAPAQ
jgi:small subunit ribosomal protein S16